MESEKYYISKDASLKWLELPCIYNMRTDELYEVDESAFNLLKDCAGKNGCRSDVREFVAFCVKEGLLSNEKQGQKRIPKKQSPLPSLRYLELQVTNRCNIRCRHCYIGKKIPIDLSLESVKRIMKEFEEIEGLRVLITGGEPLLYKHFDVLNSMLPEYEFRKVLFTNGHLLSSRILRKLNVQEIQVSIDGLADSHDYIRGKGSFKRAMDALRNSLEAGFQASVSTMIHTKNLGDFDKMDTLFHEMGIREWTVDVPCLSGYLLENTDMLPLPDVAGKYLNYGFGDGPHGSEEGYTCGLHLVCVMPDGRVAKCAFYSEHSAGHIDEGLEKCWKRIEHLRLEEIACDCLHINECRGGCRFRATVLDNPRAKDPYRCAALFSRLR